ncbi:uncharacterized protein LOC100899051 [Galendromus occidentalis]|uniref:Uncharacterized protein LOC100899051 n=1 Tax=Galendromus occidentalis TaxID=34638 RepID=A0AAJ6QX82_9ACAR|nr:uncharacterized protein LOC100899051 [Galendromus occidentalis]
MYGHANDSLSADGCHVRIVPADTIFKNRKKNPWTRDSDSASDGEEDPRQLVKGGVRFRFHQRPTSQKIDSKHGIVNGFVEDIREHSRNNHFDKFIKNSDEYQELSHMVRSLAQAVEEQESSAFSLQATTAEFKANFMNVLNLKAVEKSSRQRASKSDVIRNLGSLKGYKSFIQNPSISLRKVACLTKYLRRKGYHVSFTPSSNLVKNGRRRQLRKESLVDSDSQSVPHDNQVPKADAQEAVSSNSDASR